MPKTFNCLNCIHFGVCDLDRMDRQEWLGSCCDFVDKYDAESSHTTKIIKEIFSEIEEFLDIIEWRSYWDEHKIRRKLTELKNKYTENNK